MERRKFIKMTSVIGGATVLPGCCLFRSPPNPHCLFSHHLPQQQKLLIDSHAHIFNGSDLQVSKFVSQVQGRELVDWVWLRKMFGDFLELIVWESAPSTKDELNVINQSSSQCSNTEIAQVRLLNLREKQFIKAIAESKRAIHELNKRGDIILQSGITTQDLMNSMPQKYDDVFSAATSYDFTIDIKGMEFSFGSLWRFVIEMFQFRFVSLNNYLKTYNSDKLKTDLMISHIVDYDWPLNNGKPTASSLVSQCHLIGEISKVSNGLVHSFAPYCPFRHVAYKFTDKEKLNPLNLIKEAVELHGALGVKIYPPMGFALYGNDKVFNDHPETWKKQKHLPDFCKKDDFPKQLDEVLNEFYDFCIKHDIPIMAHSSPSNMGANDYKVCFESKYWGKLLSIKKGLRINFGHFGGFDSLHLSENSPIWHQIASTISDSSNVSNAYVDTGYFSGFIDAPDISKRNLEALLHSFPKMADSLNYGTDWKMLVIEKNNGQYLNSFQGVLQQLNNAQLESAVLGNNTAEFLGLNSRSSGNRKRLDKFYRNSVKPHWLSKVVVNNLT